MMITKKKHLNFPYEYPLLKLALIPLVTTTTFKKVLSLIKYITTNLHNQILDELLNDIVITYFADDLFESVPTDDILHQFHNIKSHRG